MQNYPESVPYHSNTLHDSSKKKNQNPLLYSQLEFFQKTNKIAKESVLLSNIILLGMLRDVEDGSRSGNFNLYCKSYTFQL